MAVTTFRRRRPPKDPEGRMPLREHLDELRKRLFRAALGVVLGAVAGWWLWGDLVLPQLIRPLQQLTNGTLNYDSVVGPIEVQVKGAIWVGLIVSSPVWIYQLWAFVTPGLTKKERRYAVGFVAAAVPLFLAGVALAASVLPTTIHLLSEFTAEGSSTFITANNYLSFVMRLLLAFGISFLVPVLLVALNFAGLVSGRAILKQWRIVVFLCFVFAAIFTPTPDALTMIVMALPLILLFFVAIGVCIWNDKRRARREGRSEFADLSDDEASPL
ncbi:twin-arginine translocase subunit TatC [Kineococcus sp. SYSU DK005]|uniref:twin-arginine translocase subunit TatC n=1 Tax=Kineococcus sp. SYSU DK005 TaxID=3383126 RepID=UPI003D7D8FC0